MTHLLRRLTILISTVLIVLTVLLAASSAILAQDPDYSGVDDLLEGDWTLIQNDDLIIANPQPQAGGMDVRNLILSTNETSVAGQSTQNLGTKPCEADDPNLQIFPQQSRVGRFFNTEYDVIITLAPRGNASGAGCGASSGDNMGFYVRDPLVAANDGTYPLTTSSFMVQMAPVDLNFDGYTDLIVINDEEIFAVTAADIDRPTAGLQIGAATALGAEQTPLNDPAVGDFNDDGLVDVAWIGGDLPAPYDSISTPIPFAVNFATICPGDVAGTLCEGAAPLDVLLDPLAAPVIEIVIDNPSAGEYCFPSIAVTAGNFAADAGDELLIVRPVPNNLCELRSEIYSFNSTMVGTKRSGINNIQPSGFAFIFPSTVYARSGNFDGAGALDDAVLAFNASGKAVTTVITVNDDAGQTPHITTTDTTGSDEQSADMVYGLAVGRFTPLANQTSAAVDANLQFAALFDNKIHVYAVPGPDSFTPVKVYEQPVNNYTNPFGPIMSRTDSATASASGSWLHAGDLQGRSLRVGPPFVIRAEGHSQPDVILGHPPMHVAYIQPSVETSETPAILNFSVLPESYNAEYQVESSSESQSSHESKTSYAYSTEETLKEKVTIKVPAVSKIKSKTEQAWSQEHEKVTEEKSLTYTSSEFNAGSRTGFGDVVWFTSNRFNIYVYPALGETICPAANPNCAPSEEAPLNLMISGPDQISRQRLSGPLIEWYQPVHEPGQILSYPWTLEQLQERNPGMQLLTSTSPLSFATDDSEEKVELKWGSGSDQESSTETTKTHSFKTANSVTAGSAKVFGSKVSVTAGFDYSNSTAVGSLQSSSSSLATSSGIGISKPGTFINPGLYAYRVQPYIFGTAPPAGMVQPVEGSADITTTGTLETGYTVDPRSNIGAWWESSDYIEFVDVALNHPQRWDIPPSVSSGGLECLRDSLDTTASTCVEFNEPNMDDLWQSQFHQMRGLLVTVNGTDGPQRARAVAGDEIHLTARVYNYSLRDMDPDTQVYARFYRQEWNTQLNEPTGESILIEEKVLSRIPGFDTTSAAPNWTTTSTFFDSTALGDRNFIFWVVVWLEDGSGLVAELPGHGLSQAPGDLASIYDAPLEYVMAEGEGGTNEERTFSNNVGYYKKAFYVEPADSAPLAAAQAAPHAANDEPHSLTIEDLMVTPSIVELGERVTVSANIASHNEAASGVLVRMHDLDPEDEDSLFDIEMLAHIEAEERHNVRVPYTPTACGTNTITVEAKAGSGPEAEAGVTLEVECPAETVELYFPVISR